jgi:hypothetical protein
MDSTRLLVYEVGRPSGAASYQSREAVVKREFEETMNPKGETDAADAARGASDRRLTRAERDG